MIYTIMAPLVVPQSKTKNFSLNLNVYRNAHHFTLNTSKIRYAKTIESQIDKLPVFTKIELAYVLYPKTKRLCDISNALCIHDKFFCDALVKAGKLEDDNYIFLAKVIYRFGEIDPSNPRVEIHIKEAAKLV